MNNTSWKEQAQKHKKTDTPNNNTSPNNLKLKARM